MISFINPEEQTPILRPSKFVYQTLSRFSSEKVGEALVPSFGKNFTKFLPYTSAAIELAKSHAEFSSKKVQEALIARFGEMPSLDEIARHCRCFYDTQNVAHYVWCDSEPKLGDEIDLSDVLCVVHPPKFGPFGSP